MRTLNLLLLLMCAPIIASERDTFSRHFTSVKLCYWSDKTEDYVSNCSKTLEGNNSFYFNFQGTTDILWVSASENRNRLRNMGADIIGWSNDVGEKIDSYNFLSADGEDIRIIWQGEWIRIVYPGLLFMHFSNDPITEEPQEEPVPEIQFQEM